MYKSVCVCVYFVSREWIYTRAVRNGGGGGGKKEINS